jgi:energy-coupling factor transporter ATP-binding protein EcfA2
LLLRPQDVYVPNTWVSEEDLFVGRKEEITKIIRALKSKGANLFIYGARGLGKTTLARHIELNSEENLVWIDCDSELDKKSLIGRIFNKLHIEHVKSTVSSKTTSAGGIDGKIYFAKAKYVQNNEKNIVNTDFSDAIESVDYICDRLQELDKPTLIILDEFDLVTSTSKGKRAAKFIVELIKASANRDKNFIFRFLIVGVGNSVSSLIGEHKSIERNIVEIQVNKIEKDFLKLFLHNAQQKTGFYFDSSVEEHFIEQADGYPYFIHLIGLACCEICEDLSVKNIDFNVYEKAFNNCFDGHFRANIKRFSESNRKLNEIEKSVIYLIAHDRSPVSYIRQIAKKYINIFPDIPSEDKILELVKAAKRLSDNNYMIYNYPNSEKFGFIDPIMKVFIRERFFFDSRKRVSSDRTRRQFEMPEPEPEITADDL